jgi:hypothetical protein
MIMKRSALLFSVVLLLSTVVHQQASGLPAFARKYKTSCTTCHVGFPKLNAFGEAFRNNGYQFPGHMDAEYVKEDAVSLGSDTSFPKEIWPGSIPGSAPVAILLSGAVDYDPTEKRVSFGEMGNMITALMGGTLGEDLAFWGQVDVSNMGVTVGRAFLRFSNLIGENYAFNMRVGAFEPAVFTFSNRRNAFADYWILSRKFSTDMNWSLENIQKGLEFNGVVDGRLSYTAGVVDGFGLPHRVLDMYGRVLYKIGGMRLDGVVEGGKLPTNPVPWMDNSISVGAFGYAGSSMLKPDSLPQENNFTMIGGEVNAWYDRFNLFGAFGLRKDNAPFVGLKNQSVNTTVWFTELDVMALPWLIPCVRAESWKSSRTDAMNMVQDFSDFQIKPGVIFVVRPNVTVSLITLWTNTVAEKMAMDMPMPATGHVHGALTETGQVQVHLMVGM